MTLQELKQNILENKVGDDFIIFVCEEDHFLADQYIAGICKAKHIIKNSINSLAETTDSALALVFDYSENLNILKVEEFNEVASDYSVFKNCIVVCDKIDKKISSLVKDYIIKLPKLVDWQVKDYMKTLCPGLDETDTDWLYKMTSGDIYRITNELDKIKCFPAEVQKGLFNDLRFDKASDLYTIGIFELVEAIAKKDKVTVLEYLKHKSSCSFEPVSISTLLLTKFRNIILLCNSFNSGIEAKDVGVSDGQKYYINKDYNKKISLGQAMRTIDFLSVIDQKLKNGQLEMDSESFMDYLICNVMR